METLLGDRLGSSYAIGPLSACLITFAYCGQTVG